MNTTTGAIIAVAIVAIVIVAYFGYSYIKGDDKKDKKDPAPKKNGPGPTTPLPSPPPPPPSPPLPPPSADIGNEEPGSEYDVSREPLDPVNDGLIQMESDYYRIAYQKGYIARGEDCDFEMQDLRRTYQNRINDLQTLIDGHQCPTSAPCPTCPEPAPCPTCPVPEPCPSCPEPAPCPSCPMCPEAEPCPTCPEPAPCPECPAPEPCPQCIDCDNYVVTDNRTTLEFKRGFLAGRDVGRRECEVLKSNVNPDIPLDYDSWQASEVWRAVGAAIGQAYANAGKK